MRLLFNFLALCVGFAMAVGTVIGITVLVAMFVGVRPGSDELFMVMGCVTVAFLLFLRVVSRLVGGITPKTAEKKGNGDTNAEESRLMQEIHHGLRNMEKRVESLETILLDARRNAAH